MATAFTPPGASPDLVARDAADAALTAAGIAAAAALAALNAASAAQADADTAQAAAEASSGLVQRDWSGGSAITTASAAGAGGVVTGDVANFFDLGVIHRLRVVANSNTVLATVQFYADAARTTLLLELAGINAFTAAYELSFPIHYRDADNTASLHYRIVNAGVAASTFTLTVQGIGE